MLTPIPTPICLERYLDGSQGLRIWDASTGKLKATLLPLSSTDDLDASVGWIAYTPDGYYAGSPMCETGIRWRVGDKVIGPNGYRMKRNSPKHVELALSGKVEDGRYQRLSKLAVTHAPISFIEKMASNTAEKIVVLPAPNTPNGKLYEGVTLQGWMGNKAKTAYTLRNVKKALTDGANINLQGGWGTSALMVLSYCGDLNAVKDLVRRGANLNQTDEYGSTALLHAIGGKRLTVFNYLLSAGATLKDENGHSLLALKGKPEALGTALVRILSSRYAYGPDSIAFDVSNVALALLHLGALPNVPNKDGSTPIQLTNDLDVVEALLRRGADVNAHAKDSSPALCKWVGQGWIDFIKVGLKHGADVNVRPKSGGTPLIIAAGNGNFDLVKLLLKHHANPNLYDKDGNTALMTAVMGRHVDILNPLLDAGAFLERKNTYFKYTALALAVYFHDLESTRILLRRGANVHKSGAKLLKLARESDASDSFGLVALLKKYGAK